MKTLIFLILIVAAFTLLIWKMRKSQAEEALARRQEAERRKQREKEALTPELDMIWPVIIRSAKADRSSRAGPHEEEPSMTTIKYEPPEQAAS